MALCVPQVLQDVQELIEVLRLMPLPQRLKPPAESNHLAEGPFPRNQGLQQVLPLCHVAKDVLDTTPGGVRAVTESVTEVWQSCWSLQ